MTQEVKAGCSCMLMGRSHLPHTAARSSPAAPPRLFLSVSAAALPQKL
jgi:hypothetical protein